MYTDVRILFCVYYRFSGFVCVAYSINDHANLHIDCSLHVTMTFLDMSWRACSFGRGCQEGTEESGVKVDEGRWLCLAGSFWFCEDPVIGKMAQVGLLLLDWEENFELGLGLKRIVTWRIKGQAIRLSESFVLGWNGLSFLTLTSQILWADGMGWGGPMWHDEQWQGCQLPSQAAPLDARGQTVSWDCQMKWMFGSPSHSLKRSIWHLSLHKQRWNSSISGPNSSVRSENVTPALLPGSSCNALLSSLGKYVPISLARWRKSCLFLLHYNVYSQAWMAPIFLTFWHWLSGWARAGLPSEPRSVTSWLLSCTVISVVWTLRLRPCRGNINLPLRVASISFG